MNRAVVCMALPTTLMAFLPTYQSIGLISPFILIIIRVFQGISAGGQFGNLITIASEDKKIRSVGLNVSIAFSTSIIGFLFASGVSYLCIHLLPPSWEAFGWRIPFGLGAILLMVFILITEKDDEKKLTLQSKSPLSQLFSLYKQHISYITLLAFITLSLYYISITYMVTYMVHFLGFSLSDALLINTLSIIFMIIIIPLFGYLSDNVGRKKCLFFTYFSSLILLPFIIYILNSDRFYTTLFMLIIFSTLVGMIQGAANPFYTEMFPKKIRATGTSISYGFGSSLSGFSPLIATLITGIFPSRTGMTILIVVFCLAGIIVTYLLNDKQLEVRRKNDLNFNASIKKI